MIKLLDSNAFLNIFWKGMTMKWKLNIDLWDSEEYNSNIKPVLTEIITKTEELIGGVPPCGYKPLWIVNDMYYGMRLYTPLNQDYYKLGLTVGHLTYGKVAYQFAHLLSYLYTDPRQVTWFSTAIAHMASFWFLDYFAEKWIDNYPGPTFEGVYEAFSALKAEKVKTAFQNVDIMLNLASNEWIREEIQKLSQSMEYAPPVIFDLIGLELEPIFKKGESWQLLKYIGKGTRKPVEDSKDLRTRPKAKPDFEKLYDIVPNHLKPVVETITNRIM